MEDNNQVTENDDYTTDFPPKMTHEKKSIAVIIALLIIRAIAAGILGGIGSVDIFGDLIRGRRLNEFLTVVSVGLLTLAFLDILSAVLLYKRKKWGRNIPLVTTGILFLLSLPLIVAIFYSAIIFIISLMITILNVSIYWMCQEIKIDAIEYSATLAQPVLVSDESMKNEGNKEIKG